MALAREVLFYLKDMMQSHPVVTVYISLILWLFLLKFSESLVKCARWFLVFLYGGFACKYHYLLAEKNMEIMRRMGLENSRFFSSSLDYNWYQGFMTGATYTTLFCIFLVIAIYEWKKSAKKPSNLDAKTTGTVRFPI